MDAGRSGQYTEQPVFDILDFFLTKRVLHGVLMSLNCVAQRLQMVTRGGGTRQQHHRVAGAMDHENRHILVGGAAPGSGFVGQRQIARHAQQAGQPVAVAQAGHQRHGAALRKAGQHDEMGRYAARLLAPYRGVNSQLRMAQTGFVLTLRQVSAQNIVLGRHLLDAIEGHRHHGCVRENKTHRAGKPQAGASRKGKGSATGLS